ncbi:hypothetical protein, variant 1 [Aphanomyces astaci]|uniref:UDENN domain-containing protein n=1 Tax=Aphanomyces astaci TaxID=112090 RepID=W4GYN6_APHAT|nr:hypothetical protein, variant 1 [Aphanomyces astaci]ETV84845.1 hypothetical protein, variant 1 [Aphanomyces astaci]|eukprot:XP_009826537.1 hypothetical protein, variant 1 [Aphanomyces astaci]
MSLFEDVLIVEFEKKTQTPQIAWRYLTDAACAHVNNNSTIPIGLAAICAPAAGKCQKRGMEFTFTISDGRARQQYGFVKQLFVASTDEELSTHVVCILGPKPMYVWFTWILRLVHARLLHDPSRGSAVELLNAIRKAGTTDHSDFTFRLALDHGASPALYTFPLHPPGAFGMRTMEPHILNNRSFTNKLQSPTVLLVLLSALLHEQKVLLVHDERDVLRGTCQLLLRLLAPFTWKHLLIPVLPEELLHYAHAPIPYLMGVTTDAYSKASSIITNAIVFNLHEERIELRNLTDGFPTLCCDACPVIPPASTATVPFAKLSTRHTSPNSNHSAVDTFRHDLQHCFMNTPDGIEACVNAFFFHVFGQVDVANKSGIIQDVMDQFLRTANAIHPPSLVRFLTALSSREVLLLYFAHVVASPKGAHFHGPAAVCGRSADPSSYVSLKRLLQKRATYVQEYPSIVQILNGFCGHGSTNGNVDRGWTTKELRPLADASYHMDQCALMVDILWERLGDSNFSTLSAVLHMLVFLAIHGCEIAMEYMRFKECQRDHCQFLQRHPAKSIVDNAAMLLDFMASPHRWFAMRASRSQELWLSTVVFPRLDIRPMAKGVPSFAALHHTIGRFHQPVHSVNLLDLDYGVPPSSSSSGVKMAAVNDDPFDTNAAFPTHWG